MIEIWKPIKGFEKIYEASTFGRIRRLIRGTKLVPADISEIRKLRLDGASLSRIAEQFGVSKPNIRAIFKGISWANDQSFRILKGSVSSDGYVSVYLRKDGLSHRNSVHRLIAKTFISDIPKGKCINHLDGNPSNNAVENLEITSYSGNIRHAIEQLGHRPTVQRGSQNGCSKLTDEQVRYVKGHVKKYGVATRLARELGVTSGAISLILNGKNWSHIPGAAQ